MAGKSEIEKLNQQMNAPEDRRQDRAQAQEDAAMQPARGAPVQHARVGAEQAADGKALDHGETAQSLKRAVDKGRS